MEERVRQLTVKRVDSRRVNRRKDEDLLKTVEEVFDPQTLMAIQHLLNMQVVERFFGVVDAGKESRVYWAKDKDGNDFAVKIYLTSSAQFHKNMHQYIDGDERFRKVGRDTRDIIYTWAQKEFKNIQRAMEAGVRVPKPVAVHKNVLIMEFIGEDGERSPLLKEYLPPEPEETLRTIMRFVRSLHEKAQLVHADLSEYNVMIHHDSPVFMDFGQAVLTSHPLANTFLTRDVNNILHFFERQANLSTPEVEAVCKWVKRETDSYPRPST